ncbi:hypothetical protein EMCRGX_G001813 [Ephydatia muelleri]
MGVILGRCVLAPTKDPTSRADTKLISTFSGDGGIPFLVGEYLCQPGTQRHARIRNTGGVTTTIKYFQADQWRWVPFLVDQAVLVTEGKVANHVQEDTTTHLDGEIKEEGANDVETVGEGPSNSEHQDGVDQGPSDGVDKGPSDGVDEGPSDGVDEGPSDGVDEGVNEGPSDGVNEGPSDGVDDGSSDGVDEGPSDGVDEGPSDGVDEGPSDGVDEGVNEGPSDDVDEGPSDAGKDTDAGFQDGSDKEDDDTSVESDSSSVDDTDLAAGAILVPGMSLW